MRQNPHIQGVLPKKFNPDSDPIWLAMGILKLNDTNLAAMLQMHRNTISHWRKGVTPAPRAVMLLLADRIKLREILLS